MISKIEFGPAVHREVFAEPTPLGLIGLALGCAALTPIAFGFRLTPAGLSTAAVICLLFGAGCQLLAGLMSFANKNLYGGTLFTAFAFNWTLNWWALNSLARGFVPDAVVVHAVEAASLVVFLVITYGFGFYSTLLFAFLADIDLLYVCKLANAIFGTRAFDLPIAVFTVGLGVLSLWIAFALLVNPTAGRVVFPIAGPLFAAARRPSFDTSRRRAIFAELYRRWQEQGFRPVGLDELERALGAQADGPSVVPEVQYLAELGGLVLTPRPGEPEAPAAVRLSAAGIDFFEQVVLKKDQFA
ncbi:MAG: GPR1/FUN34/YaaH family transporter [Thermoanaerobaculaceae bacterium]|nr:GPR1/FUN34/YaaH family transporter [Thermoanaerobaculaceae bacterium]